MNQQERMQVLGYIEKYSAEFSKLTADVMNRVLTNTMASDGSEPPAGLVMPEQGCVRINPEQFLNQQM